MSTLSTIHETKLVTADELLQMPPQDHRYELIGGLLTMMSPAGGQHGLITNRISWLLNSHVVPRRLGVVFAAETGFRIQLNPDTVRAPDVAFVTNERFATIKDASKYIPFAPDLAVEVTSPHDTVAAVNEKARGWIAAGTRIVLVVVPEEQVVHVYRDQRTVEVLSGSDMLNADVAVPGWNCSIDAFFAS